jgi:hypothetical protein
MAATAVAIHPSHMMQILGEIKSGLEICLGCGMVSPPQFFGDDQRLAQPCAFKKITPCDLVGSVEEEHRHLEVFRLAWEALYESDEYYGTDAAPTAYGMGEVFAERYVQSLAPPGVEYTHVPAIRLVAGQIVLRHARFHEVSGSKARKGGRSGPRGDFDVECACHPGRYGPLAGRWPITLFTVRLGPSPLEVGGGSSGN